MSTRQLLTKTTGTLAVLTIVAMIGVGVTWDTGNDGNTAATLAIRQQALLADMCQQMDELVAADDFAAVSMARGRLARTIVAFDQTMTALIHGATIPGENGRPLDVSPVEDQTARRALADASALWLQVGLPLADLAAGEFSVFSAAGQATMTGLRAADAELSGHMATVAAATAGGNTTGRTATTAARVAAGLLMLALAVSVRRRRHDPATSDASTATPTVTGLAPPGAQPVSPLSPTGPAFELPPLPGPAAPARPAAPYAAPVDFENVSAAVDRMTVDMSTIATSTQKMRLAIDQVGTALHAMIYNLDDLKNDSAEGYRVVRGANNAASYTVQVAKALADSVKEMDVIVAQVSQLATRTRQTAAQIDAEAGQTAGTGVNFNAAVSEQVKALAGQTSHATGEIEHTVSEMLSRTREYEEAIAHIVKHISAIHKLSCNFGEMALEPAASAVVGPPQPRRAPQPAAAVAPEPMIDESPATGTEATPEQVAADTSAAITEAAAPEAPAEPAAAPAETAPGAGDLGPEPADDDPEMDVYNKPKMTFDLNAEPAAADPEPEPEPAKPTVFMLNQTEEDDAAAAAVPATEAVAEPATEPAAEEQAAVEPEPEPTVEPEPEPTVEPVAAEPAPAADSGAEPAVAEGDSPNIFMLNVPQDEAAAPEPAAAAEPEPAPEAAPEPAPEQYDGPCLKEGETPDVFMIYAPLAAAELGSPEEETVETT